MPLVSDASGNSCHLEADAPRDCNPSCLMHLVVDALVVDALEADALVVDALEADVLVADFFRG